MTHRIETERLVLRRPVPADWPAVHGFWMSPRAAHVGGASEPVRTVWGVFAGLLGHWEIRGWGLFAVDLKGEDRVIGLIGPWFPVGWPERELGWTIFDEGLEGSGLAFEAAAAARDFAFGTLGWTTAVSYVAPENARSASLARRLGCTIDPEAAHPGASATLVYRHPAPGDRDDNRKDKGARG